MQIITKNKHKKLLYIAGIPKEIIAGKEVAREIAIYIRGHWGIENRLHRKRDMDFNEDKGTIRAGHAPQTMAILRNLTTSIFHRSTVRNFKSAMRYFAAKPEELFSFLGLTKVARDYTYV